MAHHRVLFAVGINVVLTAFPVPCPGQTEHASFFGDDPGFDGDQTAWDNGKHSRVAISGDGNFVAFCSGPAGFFDATTDVYVRDRTAGTITKVNVATDDDYCVRPDISSDGNVVAWHYAADMGAYACRWRVPGMPTEPVSVPTGPSDPAALVPGLFVALSHDGRYAAFSTTVSLVAEDTNGPLGLVGLVDVYLRDRLMETTVLCSRTATMPFTSGAAPSGAMVGPSISSDARYVVFETTSDLLGDAVPGVVDFQVYRFDRDTGEVKRASESAARIAGNDDSGGPPLGGGIYKGGHDVSADGRWVTFWSMSTNLCDPPTQACPAVPPPDQVYLKDMDTGAVELMSVDEDGVPVDGSFPRINKSPPGGPGVCFKDSDGLDGQFVLFIAEGELADSDDGVFGTDVYRRDRVGGVTSHVSISFDGKASDGNCNLAGPPGEVLLFAYGDISGDGSAAAFYSKATNLTAIPESGDLGAHDVFVRDFPPGFSDQGFIRDWLLLGPYTVPHTLPSSNPGEDAIRADHLRNADAPEGVNQFNIQPRAGDAVMTDYGPAGKARSIALAASGNPDINPDGVPTWGEWRDLDDTIDFREYYVGNINDVMMHALTYIVVPGDMTLDIALASDDAVQVLLDGEEIWINDVARPPGGPNEIQDTVCGDPAAGGACSNAAGVALLTPLTAGAHRLMVKVFQGGGLHAFRLRFQEPGTGVAVTDPLMISLDPDGLIPEEGFSEEGFIKAWLLLGPYAQPPPVALPPAGQPGEDAIRADHLRNADGSTNQVEVEPRAGDTVMTDYGPEGTARSIALAAAVGGNPHDTNPAGVPTWGEWRDPDDTIAFDEYYGGGIEDVMMHALTYVLVEEDMTVDIALASNSSVQVFLDGEEIWINNVLRGPGVAKQVQDNVCGDPAAGRRRPCSNAATVTSLAPLTAGFHKLMVKVFDAGGGYGLHAFRLRFRDPGTLEAITKGITIGLDPMECFSKPPAPPVLTGATRDQRQVELSWTAAQGCPAPDAYAVYRSVWADGPFQQIAGMTAAQMTYVDALAEDVTYCYLVRSVSCYRESTDSDVLCAAPVAFRRGDVNASGSVDLTDAIVILSFLFLGQADRTLCIDAADIKDRGAIDISDAINVLTFLFLGGPPPAPPGPFVCGLDANAETPDLGCALGC